MTEILKAIDEHPKAFVALVVAVWLIMPTFAFRWKRDDK